MCISFLLYYFFYLNLLLNFLETWTFVSSQNPAPSYRSWAKQKLWYWLNDFFFRYLCIIHLNKNITNNVCNCKSYFDCFFYLNLGSHDDTKYKHLESFNFFFEICKEIYVLGKPQKNVGLFLVARPLRGRKECH